MVQDQARLRLLWLLFGIKYFQNMQFQVHVWLSQSQ